MLNGNISNKSGTSILINIESIFKLKEKPTIIDKVQTLLRGIVNNCKIDTNNLAFTTYLVRKTDIAVTLVSDNALLVEELKANPILNCRVIYLEYTKISKALDIRMYDYYVDDDAYRLNIVNRKTALSIEEFRKLGVR